MTDPATPPADPTPPAGATPPSDPPADPPADPSTPPAADPPGSEALGDAGKKALDAMKAERKAARDAAAAEKARADALQAKLDGKEAEHQAEQEKRETEKAALAKANQRILRSEIKAAAKGVLADPADAYKFLDLDSFEVGEDGEVDDAAITAALTELVSTKPYLAAQGGRFQGSADGGARNDATKAAQLTRSDLNGMTPQQIEAARKEGRLNDVLGIKS